MLYPSDLHKIIALAMILSKMLYGEAFFLFLAAGAASMSVVQLASTQSCHIPLVCAFNCLRGPDYRLDTSPLLIMKRCSIHLGSGRTKLKTLYCLSIIP